MHHSNTRLHTLARLIFALAALALGQVSQAQTVYIWSGAVSSEWTTQANWTPHGIPSNSAGDVASFGASARTEVDISTLPMDYSMELKFLVDAPAYTINVGGNLGIYLNGNGISNASTTTHPKFVIEDGRVMQLFTGTLSDSEIDNDGVLSISAPAAGDSASVLNRSDGKIDISTLSNSSGATGTSIGALNGVGTLALGSFELSVGNLNRADFFDGTIGDRGGAGGTGGALTKIGSGSLTLGGVNAYTGQTTVTSGALVINGNIASSSKVLVDSFATLGGAGTIGDLLARSASLIIPGDSTPASSLTGNRLLCANAPVVQVRIGQNGVSSVGTFLKLNEPLLTGFCPSLHFRLTSAGQPLVLGQNYLLAFINGNTNFSAANVSFDFLSFDGRRTANGQIIVANARNGTSTIVLALTDAGDDIFRNGFELFN